MKLSIALSLLLVGSSLFMNGCDSSSDSDVEKPAKEVLNNVDKNTTDLINELEDEATALTFSTEMLAGKTFYGYGYERQTAELETGDRFKIIVSSDASKMEIWSSDGSEKYGDATSSIISDSKDKSAIKWQVDGMSDIEFALLKVFDDESFMVLPMDPDHYEPYPILFSTTEREDKGLALYNEFVSEQTISKEKLSANKWYSINWGDDSVNCDALYTYNTDNTLDISYIEDGTTKTEDNIGTYVVSGNIVETSISLGEETKGSTYAPLYVSEDKIVFREFNALFKNRADAVEFVTLKGGDEGCYSSFPE